MKLSGSRYQCTFCGLHYAGPLSLDRHRADLKCLSVEGMHAVGLRLNRSGFWTLERSAWSDDPTPHHHGATT
jgi:hypothetical protein